MSLDYKPPPTIEAFMMDDSLVRVVVGPVGSGKSMGCIMELLRRSCLQTPHNGVRYSRHALIRNTLQQLRQTVLADVQQYLGPLLHYFVTDSTIQIRARLADGTFLHADWVMIPLDTKEDVGRLLSMQLTGAWINEVREVPIEVTSALLGRLGRYPSKLMGGPTWFGLVCDTNPWDTDSAYHERLVLNPDPKWRLFHQPSGIGPDAENIANLPDGYYDNLAGDRNKDWAAVHVESEWGTSNAGQAVFRRSFDAIAHVRDMQVVVNPNRPLMIGIDFGRTPCAVIGQVDIYGRALIFKEVITEGMGLNQMVQEHLKPSLMDEPFAGRRCFIVGDPAGMAKSQVTEETPFDALRSLGFMAFPASTNDIDKRLSAVEQPMRSLLGGQPGLQINRAGCPTLIRSLGNKYRFRKRKDGSLEDSPEKLHPWSDVVDALQYFCLGLSSNITGKVVARERPRTTVGRMPSGGWT